MAVREPVVREDPSGGIVYDAFVPRKVAGTRAKDTDEPSLDPSPLYQMCRVRANLTSMLQRRGYKMTEKDDEWIECSRNEEALLRKAREYMRVPVEEFAKKEFSGTYEITLDVIPYQTTYTMFPYTREGGEELGLGEFGFAEGRWVMVRPESDIVEKRTFQTKISTRFGDIRTAEETPFSIIPSEIIVLTSPEKKYVSKKAEFMAYRRKGVEVFHISELLIDVFQHWLVSEQRLLSDVEKLKLLSPFLMLETSEGEYTKVSNGTLTERSLPTVSHEDIAVRILGGLNGSIIYWENASYISMFSNREFGYMAVTGGKIPTNVPTEGDYGEDVEDDEDMFPRDQDDGGDDDADYEDDD